MDALDFMEETATANFKIAAESYDAAYERVNKLAAHHGRRRRCGRLCTGKMRVIRGLFSQIIQANDVVRVTGELGRSTREPTAPILQLPYLF
jgi:hypothetical protein